MANIEAATATRNLRWAGGIAFGALALGVAIALLLNWRAAPQMGADEEVFDTVDALFTAVTARDDKLLAACEGRLNACREAGKLPKASADFLAGVIAKARRGGWETAAERLYDFMAAQKREGYRSPPRKHSDNPKKKG